MSPKATQDAYTPRPEHRFTFGLWTVGNPGRDPFGEPTRAPLDPVESVERLAELGAYGVSLHDNDLVPYGTSPEERDRIVQRFRDALERTGLRVTMATGCASPSSPSRTSRAARSSCPPSGTRCTSSPRSTNRTWSGSTRSSLTRRWPGSAS